MSRVVLFDFDGTLIRGDSATDLLRSLLRGRPLRRLCALLSLPLLLGFVHWRTASFAASWFLWLCTVGRAPGELARAQSAYVTAFAAQRERRLIACALARLRAHLAAGDRIYVVTAAGEELARAMWAAVDGPPVTAIIGSQTRPCLHGVVIAFHCYGPRKLVALRAHGVEPPFACAYSDSPRDLPLLRAAVQAFVVEPEPRAERALRAALGAVPVLRDRRSPSRRHAHDRAR